MFKFSAINRGARSQVSSSESLTGMNILEEDKRLSESRLWTMLESYYRTMGPQAWNQLAYYPTSNAFIGEIYAELIIAFLTDLQPHLIPGEPVYIVELAAGTGCFSHFCLNSLTQKLAYFQSLARLPICYLMTDFTEKNVAVWEDNQDLKVFGEAGVLDFAVFAPEVQPELRLRRSGKVLSCGTLQNPMIVIANYFFDSIRQDYFQIQAGQLFEGLVTLAMPSEVEPDNPLPDFEQLQISERYLPITLPHYAEQRHNQLLEQYQAEFSNASIVFPIGPLNCLANLEKLSPQGLMLISTDKGFDHGSYMQDLRPLPFTAHTGVFSYMVNYHALGRYFENVGGQAFHTQKCYDLATMVGLTPLPFGCAMEQTRYVIGEQMQKRSLSKNLMVLKELLKRVEIPAGAQLKQIYKLAMACVQISNYDPDYFQLLAVNFENALMAYDIEHLEDDLLDLLYRVEGNLYYAAVGYQNALFWLRELYYELDEFERCERLNNRLISDFGPDALSCYMRGALFEIRKEFASALTSYLEARNLNPDDEQIQSSVSRLESLLEALNLVPE